MNKHTVESLRIFALANNETAFAHLVSEALYQLECNSEGWAVERIADTLRRIDAGAEYRDADQDLCKLSAIRATNITRPDGGKFTVAS